MMQSSLMWNAARNRRRVYQGTVGGPDIDVVTRRRIWHVTYDDGESEDMFPEELERYLFSVTAPITEGALPEDDVLPAPHVLWKRKELGIKCINRDARRQYQGSTAQSKGRRSERSERIQR